MSELKRELISDPELKNLLRPIVEEIMKKRPPVFYTRKQAAEILNVSTRTIDSRLADGSLVHKKVGDRVLIPEEAIIK